MLNILAVSMFELHTHTHTHTQVVFKDIKIEDI